MVTTSDQAHHIPDLPICISSMDNCFNQINTSHFINSSFHQHLSQILFSSVSSNRTTSPTPERANGPTELSAVNFSANFQTVSPLNPMTGGLLELDFERHHQQQQQQQKHPRPRESTTHLHLISSLDYRFLASSSSVHSLFGIRQRTYIQTESLLVGIHTLGMKPSMLRVFILVSSFSFGKFMFLCFLLLNCSCSYTHRGADCQPLHCVGCVFLRVGTNLYRGTENHNFQTGFSTATEIGK